MNILFSVTDKLEELAKAYSEPHRRYHNMSHIARMFHIADLKKLQLNAAQILAIWYHDFIYVPTMKDNEEKSVEAMRKSFYGGPAIMNSVLEEASKIILDTKAELPERWFGSAEIIDLDLWDLGTGFYAENAKRIKEEFLPYCKDEQHFINGRIQWLESMLARDTIYVSNFVSLEHERNARQNIKTELKALTHKCLIE